MAAIWNNGAMLDPHIVDAASEVARMVWLQYVCAHSEPDDIDCMALECILAEVAHDATEDLKRALCEAYNPDSERPPAQDRRGVSC